MQEVDQEVATGARRSCFVPIHPIVSVMRVIFVTSIVLPTTVPCIACGNTACYRRDADYLRASSHCPCCGDNHNANLLLPDRL